VSEDAAVDSSAADRSSVNGSQQHDDAEDEEGSARGEPSEDTEPIVDGTAPASSLPTDPQNNEPQVPEVPPLENDNPSPSQVIEN
jgi:hypothetical protein